jgi:hypothetical protein
MAAAAMATGARLFIKSLFTHPRSHSGGQNENRSFLSVLGTLCDVCSTTDEVAIFVGLAAGGALIGYLIAREERLLIYSAP